MNGDYEDLPDELNQSKDNADLAEEGEDDEQQVKVTGLASNWTKLYFGQVGNFQKLQGGGGMVNGIKLPNGRIIKKVTAEDLSVNEKSCLVKELCGTFVFFRDKCRPSLITNLKGVLVWLRGWVNLGIVCGWLKTGVQ